MTFFKHVGKWIFGGKTYLVKLAVRDDPDWERHFKRSWKKRRYWIQGQGKPKRAYRLQVMDLIIEWNLRYGR